MDGDVYLQFEASKSQWSDVYRFDVNLYRNNTAMLPCFSTALSSNGQVNYNWQLMTDQELNSLLDEAIQNWLSPIANTPLAELGSKEEIWHGCTCKRTKCDTCWVQKNLWEANK